MNPANTGYMNAPGVIYPPQVQQTSLFDARTTIAEEKITNLEKQIQQLQRQLEFVQTLYLKQLQPVPIAATVTAPLEAHVPTLPASAPASPKAQTQKGGGAQVAHATVATTASPAAMSSRRTIV